jgi:FkbH-like protein
VVWDLDNTVWSGTLLEGDQLALRPGIEEIFHTLDSWGVLQSVASRNELEPVLDQLKVFGIEHWFLVPQVNWGAKHQSVKWIAQSLNIGTDSILLVDDQPFEREEVRSILPEVRVLDPMDLQTLLNRKDLQPSVVTAEGRRRRLMYLENQQRLAAERNFARPTSEFLASLDSEYIIRRVAERDLARASELIVRTNQLNATGRTYSVEELAAFCSSDQHDLLAMELTDRFGSFGVVGLALVDRGKPDVWLIKSLLTSCRVMARGAPSVLLGHLAERAAGNGVRLRSDFVHTGRNRAMFATYRFAGFRQVGGSAGEPLLEYAHNGAPPAPVHSRIVADW